MGKNLRFKNKGFTLIEVAVALLLMSSVVMIMSGGIVDFFRKKNTIDINQTLSGIRGEIAAALRRPDVITSIKAKNPTAFNCLNGATPDCFGVSNQIIDLVDSTGATLNWTLVDPAAGIGPTGTLCNNFDKTNPNPSCTYKFIATWDALCNSNPCPNPTIVVRVRLDQALTATSRQMSEGRFQITQPFRQTTTDLSIVCSGNGAYYDAALKRCVTPPTYNMGCPVGTYMRGFDHNGNAHCVSFPTIAPCPAGQVLKQINTDGTIVCQEGCMASTLVRLSNRCLPPVTAPEPYGSQVQSLLSRGLVRPDQVMNINPRTGLLRCQCARTNTCL